MGYNVNYPLELGTLIDMLTAKGYVDVDASIGFRTTDGDDETRIRLSFDYRARADGPRDYKIVTPWDVEYSPEPIAYFAKAQAIIKGLPTVREALIKEFVNQIEELKVRAEDLEVDVDFVNPLAELMKKLATNALTHIKS